MKAFAKAPIKIQFWVIPILISFIIFNCSTSTSPKRTVSIVNPANGAIVFDTVLIIATVSDIDWTTEVEFWVDGDLEYTDYCDTAWYYAWNTRYCQDSTRHTLQAKAYNSLRKGISSKIITVLVDNRDHEPPYAINDLAAVDSSVNSVTLGWTAPFDERGTPVEYDLRYSTKNITEANFESATNVPGVPAPADPGEPEIYEVTGLTEETTYYFALKTKDDSDNWSTISNVVSARPVDNIFPDPGLETVIRDTLDQHSGSIDTLALLTVTRLHAAGLAISDLSGLELCANLEILDLDDNDISDISRLAGLTKLRYLWLQFNDIVDISPLVENGGLGSGDELWLTNNPLSSQSIYVHIPTLKDRGVTVNY